MPRLRLQADLALAFTLESIKHHRPDLKLCTLVATHHDRLVIQLKEYIQSVLALKAQPNCLRLDVAIFSVQTEWRPRRRVCFGFAVRHIFGAPGFNFLDVIPTNGISA
jgi:hypothetical protein